MIKSSESYVRPSALFLFSCCCSRAAGFSSLYLVVVVVVTWSHNLAVIGESRAEERERGREREEIAVRDDYEGR